MRKKTNTKPENLILDDGLLLHPSYNEGNEDDFLSSTSFEDDVLEDCVLDDGALEDIVVPNPQKDRDQYYIIPKEFDEKIADYYETGILSNELASMVSKIAHKLSYAPNFINYSFKDDMIGDAIMRMMKALMSRKYDRKKGKNPFSYFTRIAFNAFRNRIKREKNSIEVREKYREQLEIFSDDYRTYEKNGKPRLDINTTPENF